MKKVILVLLCFLTLKVFALDYNNYCSSNTYNKNFKGNLASISGVNFLARKIAAQEISKSLEESIKTKFKVKLDNYYGIALTDGIFKNLTIEGKNFTYDDMIISNMEAKTLCPYNHIQYKNDKITYINNLVLGYSVDITQDDLNKSIKSSKFLNAINKINNDKFLSSLFKIENLRAQLDEDKLSLNYRIVPLPNSNDSIFSFIKKQIKPFDVKMGAGLRVVDNKIELCDFDFNSKKADYSYFLPFVNMLNPLNQKIKVDKNNEGDLKIDSVKIKTDKISIHGAIIVPGQNNK